MDFTAYLNQAIAYGKTHTTVVLIAAAVLALLTFLKPKTMFKLYGACLLAVVGLYLVSLFVGAIGSGSKQKNQMIYKTRDAAGE